MNERPVALKLGFSPSANVFKILPGEYHFSVAEMLTLKVLFYFGSLVEEWKNQVMLPPEYFNMYKTLETAIRLDPYNADPYYFAQAIFTWDVGRAHEVNQLLEYGMQYRTWDPMLPFFAGFNAGYFLKDFDQASKHMARAAELSGSPGLARLASRYYYEAGQLDLAIQFLEQMIRLAPSRQESELYLMRKEGLEAVKLLQSAILAYAEKTGKRPTDLDDLLRAGILAEFPRDPYGGTFYLDDAGQVRSTSNLARVQGVENEKE